MSLRIPAPLTAIVLAAAAACLLPSTALAQATEPVDRIAAIVDEDVVLQSELDLAMRNIQAQYAGNEAQLPPRAVLERQVLERLVLTRLQVERARSQGIRPSDQEINQAVSAIAQQNGLSVDGLRQRLASDGMSFDDFRRSLGDEITLQRLRQNFAQSRINVSEAEVDAALSQQANSTQYHLAHILVGLPEGATAEQIATGQSKIDGIKSVIERGELNFSAAAVRYSDSPNALEGGDLGWRSLDEIPSAFAQTITALSPGQMLGPIRGPSGFQLLQLVDTRSSDAAAGTQTVTEYHARHILARVNDRQDEATARARIDTLRARIAGGADFQDVAREGSEDNNTRGKGGDLGAMTLDAFKETTDTERDIPQPRPQIAQRHGHPVPRPTRAFGQPALPAKAATVTASQELFPVLRHARPHLRQLEILTQPLGRRDQCLDDGFGAGAGLDQVQLQFDLF